MWNRYCTVWIEDLTEGSTFSYKLSWSSWQGIQSQHFANAICGCRSHFSAPAVSEGAFSHPLLPGAKPASRRVIFKWRKLSMEYREAQVVRKPRVHDKVAVQGNPCWNKATTKDCFPGGMRGKRYCTFFCPGGIQSFSLIAQPLTVPGSVGSKTAALQGSQPPTKYM